MVADMERGKKEVEASIQRREKDIAEQESIFTNLRFGRKLFGQIFPSNFA
jgi:hypothetical protein